MGEEPVAHRMSRRTILKGVGSGLLTVVVLGAGVVSYKAATDKVLDYDGGHAYDPWRDWPDQSGALGIVSAAILSANPHNIQPWIFRVSDHRIDLYADPVRNSGALDSLEREKMVGLGCALENMAIAAGPRGFDTAIEVLPDGNPAHIATVTLTGAASSSTGGLYAAIGNRRSNRGPYTADPVTDQELRFLTSQVAGQPGLELSWFTTAPQRSALGALMIDAATAINADRQQSIDSFRWFRSTEGEIESHRDGLTDWGQDLSDPISSAGVILPPERRTAGDQFWLTQTKTVHTRTAAAYGVVTVIDPNDPRTRIDGGMLLQRLHLAATDHGLAFQHMNQITERIDRQASQGTAPTFAQRYDALLATPGRSPLVSFRIGHPVRPGRLSPRRPVGWVTQ
jgi:hypothetical protein